MERLKTMAIVVLLAALAGSIALATTGSGDAEVRIEARRLADGRTEFALSQRVDGEWSERILPRSRYFPAEVDHERWLRSSSVTVSATSTDGFEGEPEPAAASRSYTPQRVADGNNADASLVWATLDAAAGFRTILAVTGNTNDGTFDNSVAYLTCDHDDPDAAVYARIGINWHIGGHVSWNSRFDDDRSGSWRIGTRYDSSAYEGDILGSSHIDDSWFYVTTPNLVEKLAEKRWLSAQVPTGYDDWVTVTIDFDDAFSTPVQQNLANCGR